MLSFYPTHHNTLETHFEVTLNTGTNRFVFTREWKIHYLVLGQILKNRLVKTLWLWWTNNRRNKIRISNNNEKEIDNVYIEFFLNFMLFICSSIFRWRLLRIFNWCPLCFPYIPMFLYSNVLHLYSLFGFWLSLFFLYISVSKEYRPGIIIFFRGQTHFYCFCILLWQHKHK